MSQKIEMTFFGNRNASVNAAFCYIEKRSFMSKLMAFKAGVNTVTQVSTSSSLAALDRNLETAATCGDSMFIFCMKGGAKVYSETEGPWNIILVIVLYLIGIVCLIMLLMLIQLVYLKIVLIDSGEIKHVYLIIKPTWPERGVEVKCKCTWFFYVFVAVRLLLMRI